MKKIPLIEKTDEELLNPKKEWLKEVPKETLEKFGFILFKSGEGKNPPILYSKNQFQPLDLEHNQFTFPQYPITYLDGNPKNFKSIGPNFPVRKVRLDGWCRKELSENVHYVECPFVANAFYLRTAIRICDEPTFLYAYPYVFEHSKKEMEKIFQERLSSNLVFDIHRTSYHGVNLESYGMFRFIEEGSLFVDFGDVIKSKSPSTKKSLSKKSLTEEEIEQSKKKKVETEKKDEKFVPKKIGKGRKTKKELKEMSRDDLYQIAKDRGLKGHSKTKKAELIEVIFESYKK